MRVLCQESMTTEGVVVGSGAGPTELYPNGDESVDDVGRENVFVLNDTREALSHDGSEHNSVSGLFPIHSRALKFWNLTRI